MFSLPSERVLWLLLAAPSAAVLAMVLFNLVVWPRGRAKGRVQGRVSVLIPARNEARTIVRCVRAVLAGKVQPDEIIVYDDGSTDGTAEILERLVEMEPRLRVVHGGDLPPGWVGKPHACHRLAQAATGDVLVFLDADVVPSETMLARVGDLLERYRADCITAGLRQTTILLSEQMVVPLLTLTYLAWLPLPFIWRTRNPRFLIANGQLLAVRREALERAGGWEAVRGEIVDDMAFCRRVKETGGRVVFADGFQMASVRMYHTRADVLNGFSKNLYEGVGGHPLGLAMVFLLYGGIFLAPWITLVAAINGWGEFLRPSLAGVGAHLLMRSVMAVRYRQIANTILLHPFGIFWVLAIAANSFRWARRDQIHWRGRTYASRRTRMRGSPAGGG
ncbi:MAG TPA: glycosyltransferase family 2 protein [Longimicrobium sp.]|nr:glycosyltransferase family 2 protein [Longimicrobium sp.]